MKKIVVLNGSGTSGKDTFCKLAANESCVYGFYAYNISSVDEVKYIAKKMGWSGKKEEKERQFLSDLKDLWTDFNNGPFNYIVNTIEYNELDTKYLNEINNHDYNTLVFVHIREPEEIQKVVDHYGIKDCITVLIQRDGIEQYSNRADAEVDNYNYSCIIDNNGSFEDLKNNAIKFLEGLNE